MTHTERAEEICDKTHEGYGNCNYSQTVELVSQAFQDVADEARDEAVDEAAKVAEEECECLGGSCAVCDAVKEIRSMKSPPDAQEHVNKLRDEWDNPMKSTSKEP